MLKLKFVFFQFPGCARTVSIGLGGRAEGARAMSMSRREGPRAKRVNLCHSTRRGVAWRGAPQETVSPPPEFLGAGAVVRVVL